LWRENAPRAGRKQDHIRKKEDSSFSEEKEAKRLLSI
jgi:hypothetical protein